jgi:hypothetical protein
VIAGLVTSESDSTLSASRASSVSAAGLRAIVTAAVCSEAPIVAVSVPDAPAVVRMPYAQWFVPSLPDVWLSATSVILARL